MDSMINVSFGIVKDDAGKHFGQLICPESGEVYYFPMCGQHAVGMAKGYELEIYNDNGIIKPDTHYVIKG